MMLTRLCGLFQLNGAVLHLLPPWTSFGSWKSTSITEYIAENRLHPLGEGFYHSGIYTCLGLTTLVLARLRGFCRVSLRLIIVLARGKYSIRLTFSTEVPQSPPL